MSLFGSSGARGVVGEAFTPDLVARVAGAAAAEWGVDRVAVGRDTRTSGDAFASVAAGALATAGVDVDRLGVVPTPAVARYCATESVPAVHVTASHNPPEYNGIKLVDPDGTELDRDSYDSVAARIDDAGFAPWAAVGSTRRVEGVNDDYRADVTAGVDRDRIAAADLTVAVDPGHGAGALVSPDLFRDLGATVRTVNADPDGTFPGRDPEPVAENLADLRRLVRATDADVGVAHDGDADRAVFVDEEGTVIDGDASLAALAAAEVEAGDVVVAAVNVSQRLVDVVDGANAELDLTPIGSTHIVTRIRERQQGGARVPVAGEGNGGVFFPEHRLVRDGAYTAAKFLELLADAPASEVVAPHTDYHFVRRNVGYGDDAERNRLLAAAESYARDAVEEAVLDTTDGYRLDYGDAWVLVRPSGTEPKIRVYAEAREAPRAEALADGLCDHLNAAR